MLRLKRNKDRSPIRTISVLSALFSGGPQVCTLRLQVSGTRLPDVSRHLQFIPKIHYEE